MLPSDSLGVHDLAFIMVSLGTSPALEVNAFVLSTSALVSVNALAQAKHLEAGILWPCSGSLPLSHTCHRASAFPVSAKPFLVCVSKIVTIWYRSLLSYPLCAMGKWAWWKCLGEYYSPLWQIRSHLWSSNARRSAVSEKLSGVFRLRETRFPF